MMVMSAGIAADFEGKVIGVLDGDTIEVLHEKKTERIRLYGIDCPEKGQAFGQTTSWSGNYG
jgi:endonuclease YncB( thermonuclease family)